MALTLLQRLLKRFDSKDAENICKEIGNFPIIDQEIKDCVLDEFSEIIESSVNSNLGGLGFAQKSLELAHGDYKANNMMNRIAPVRDSLEFMDDIKEMDSGQIYNVLRFEQPQTIAFVLANVDADKGSEVLPNDAAEYSGTGCRKGRSDGNDTHGSN